MPEFHVSWETVVLVMALVAGIKRHDTNGVIKGWRTVAIALLASVALSYDYPLPPWAQPLLSALRVFAIAVGGHAYVSRLSAKFGLRIPYLPLLDSSVFPDREAATNPAGRSIRPGKREKDGPLDGG